MNTNRMSYAHVALLLVGLMASSQVIAKPSKSAKRMHQLEKRIAKHVRILARKKLSPTRAKRVDAHLVKLVTKLSAKQAKRQERAATKRQARDTKTTRHAKGKRARR
jgi:hypothetical protein